MKAVTMCFTIVYCEASASKEKPFELSHDRIIKFLLGLSLHYFARLLPFFDGNDDGRKYKKGRWKLVRDGGEWWLVGLENNLWMEGKKEYKLFIFFKDFSGSFLSINFATFRVNWGRFVTVCDFDSVWELVILRFYELSLGKLLRRVLLKILFFFYFLTNTYG